MVRVIGLFILFTVMLACSKKDVGPKTNPDVEFIEEYIATNTLTTTSPSSGVYKYSIVENATGNSSGDVFSIYYTLTDLRSGSQIDSHQAGDGDPIKLQNNANAIFPLGLESGIDGIKEGETYGIILTGKVGYEDYPTSAIPEDAILLFEVEVVTRETEADIATEQDTEINDYITDNDLNNTMTNPVDEVQSIANGIYYKRTVAGNGVSPATGDSITIDYTARYLDESSVDGLSNFKYKFNSGAVISGLDAGMVGMEQGESRTIFIPAAQAYGSSAVVIPPAAYDHMIELSVVPAYSSKVLPYEVLIFDVTLQTVH